MAKQQINKPKSRAAKRAATPPMELDVERPKSPTQLEKVALLGLRGDNGVQKRKTNRCKILSTKQKLRKEKLLERGESVIEKLATKREESKEKSRTVQGRRGEWKAMNAKMQDELESALALATVPIPVVFDTKL